MDIGDIPGFRAAYRTGSSYTCNPPVLTTDVDYLVLIREGMLDKADAFLKEQGFDWCGVAYNVDAESGVTYKWNAFRKGDLNLIVQASLTLYMRSVAATELARRMNLMDKQDRIALFRMIKFGRQEAQTQFDAEEEPFSDDLIPSMSLIAV